MTEAHRVTMAAPAATTAIPRVAAPAGATVARENGHAPAKPPAVARVDARDPRYLALRNFAISMSVFNILGYALLGFEQPWTWPLFSIAIGYAVELSVEWISARVNNRAPGYSGNGAWGLYTFLLPAHITALAANMLLYANDKYWPIAFAVIVAVGQKAVLQAPIKGRMRHFMNPSNLGITVALLVFPWVNVAPPYHFTENVPDTFRLYIPMIILTAGTVLNAMLTKKVPLILGWLGAFVIQAIVRAVVWDVGLLAALGPMTGVAFILFTNYMITDPGTTPTLGRWQFAFGASVAVVYGVLIQLNVVYTLFFAVTIVCAARGGYWWMRWLRERRGEPVPPAGMTSTPGVVASTS